MNIVIAGTRQYQTEPSISPYSRQPAPKLLRLSEFTSCFGLIQAGYVIDDTISALVYSAIAQLKQFSPPLNQSDSPLNLSLFHVRQTFYF